MKWHSSLSRRRVLKASASIGAGALALRALPARAAASPITFLTARSDADDNDFATIFDIDGTILFDLPLDARGHGAAQHPQRAEALLFGRRPGADFTVIDLATGSVRATIAAAPNRHFNGHGIVTPDGARLFATETIGDSGDGAIGIYDPADGYARIGEFASGGLDPHDIRWRPDGTIIVANGGLLVDPAAPGIKLNIDTMDASLAILDPRDGALLQSIRLAPALYQLSLRHLAVDADGTVAVAMQYEGPDLDLVPLIGYLPLGGDAIAMLDLPVTSLQALDHYCGSAAIDSDGRLLAVTSPRGGHVVFWDLPRRQFVGTIDMIDGCGVAGSGTAGEFMLSSGLGALLRASPERRLDGIATDGSTSDDRSTTNGTGLDAATTNENDAPPPAIEMTLLHDADPSAPTLRWDNHILRLNG